MQSLNVDVFSIISSYLPDKSINVLAVSTKTLSNIISKVRENNLFWKEHTEVLLRKKLKSREINWKKAYDVLAKAINEEKPVIYAIKSKNVDAVSVLIEVEYDPSDNDNKAIRFASENGHTEVVKLLLEDSRVDLSANDNEAIRYASQYGHKEVVRLLLKDPRVDPSAKDNYAIRWASKEGHAEIVKLLINDQRAPPIPYRDNDTRVDPSVYDNSPIRDASANGKIEVIKVLLLDPRVNPSDYNNEAIRLASKSGHIEVVKLLLQDPRVDPSDKNNEATRFASANGEIKVAKLLLQDSRVDPSDSNNVAIYFAVLYNNIGIVQLLLKDNRVDPLEYPKFKKNDLKKEWFINLIKEKIRNRLSGSETVQIETKSEMIIGKDKVKFYNKFLNYIIRTTSSILQCINKLKKITINAAPTIKKFIQY